MRPARRSRSSAWTCWGRGDRCARARAGAKLGGQISHSYLTSLGHTIAGGTAEVLRTTIAVRGLGLPAEPKADARSRG